MNEKITFIKLEVVRVVRDYTWHITIGSFKIPQNPQYWWAAEAANFGYKWKSVSEKSDCPHVGLLRCPGVSCWTRHVQHFPTNSSVFSALRSTNGTMQVLLNFLDLSISDDGNKRHGPNRRTKFHSFVNNFLII